jgi:hypothetical protein
VLAAIALAMMLAGAAPGRTQSPVPYYRFLPIEEIERLLGTELEGPLSRPAPVREANSAAQDAPAFFAQYRTSDEVAAFIQDLAAEYPDLTETFLAGTSWQGRPIHGIRLGNEQTGDPDLRPALYLDGQHHAREPISSHAALYTLWWLLSEYGTNPLATHLLDTRTVYAIPSLNPDGNDVWLDTDFGQRRNANPTCCDDDNDGLFDEDPANGMGWGTFRVYLYTFDAGWVVAHPTDPFAPGWQSHVLSIADMGVWDSEDQVVPQLDDDGDQHVSGPNEDPIGGVDLNRNYDAHWELGNAQVSSETYRGPSVWSEPESRAVRDWVLAHSNIIVAATLHSGADVILHPWGWSQNEHLPDGQVYERIARKGSQLTECCGFYGAPHAWTARGLYMAPGCTMDWMYGQGIYAFTPEIYAASSIAKVRRYDNPAYPSAFLVYTSTGVLFNPADEDLIAQSCERWRRFLVYLLAAVPVSSFTDAQVEEDMLTIRVANDGGITADVLLQASSDDGQAFSERVSGLRGRQYVWQIPVESLVGHTLTLTATTHALIGTNPRAFSPSVLQVCVEEDGVEIVNGEIRPFISLADFFGPGGWDADPRRWEPGYHQGPEIGYRLMFPAVRQ